MLDNFIFIGLPYGALALFIFVVPYRYYVNRLTWTPYSSQFLERKTLYWGAMAWHFGIVTVLMAHLIGFLAPRLVEAIISNQTFFLALENISRKVSGFRRANSTYAQAPSESWPRGSPACWEIAASRSA